MPKIVDHNAYRKSLVEQATQVFAQNGYNIGMRDMAAALAVSKGTLYHYFPTKESLFQAVCEAVVQTDIAALHTAGSEANTLEMRLHALMRYCLEHEPWFVQQFVILSDFVRVAGAEAASQNTVIRNATDEYLRAIAVYLQLDDLTTVTGIFVFINGLITQRYLDGQQTDFDQLAHWFVQTVLRSLNDAGRGE